MAVAAASRLWVWDAPSRWSAKGGTPAASSFPSLDEAGASACVRAVAGATGECAV